MKAKNKFIKYFTLAGAVAAVSVPTVAVLSSCSTAAKEFTIATQNDVFANSVTQLGGSFTDSPSTTEFNSVYGSLVTYVNEGDYWQDENGQWHKTEARMVLEAASKIVVYGNKDSQNAGQDQVIHTVDSANMNDAKAFINNNGVYSINVEEFGKAMLNATKVEFTLNPKFQWVDTSGNAKQSLVPNDFLYGLKGYKISSDYGLNANGYFLDMSGIDYQKTVEFEGNNSTEAGGKFTYVISDKTKNPNLLDILNKQYFFPTPHTHPDANAILGTPNDPKGLTFKEVTNKDGSKSTLIDKTQTNWANVYGGAQEKGVDVWSIGPYYLGASSQQDVTFKISPHYFEAMKDNYASNQLDINKKIPTVIKKYKAGTPDQIYNKFVSGELSYAAVPKTQEVDAISKFSGKPEFIVIPSPKTSQSQVIGYNLGIYDKEGKIKNSNLVNDSYVKFVQEFHSPEALKIRKGINEYINWAFLSEIKFKSSPDITLSSVPYGVFPVKEQQTSTSTIDYYEAIGNSKPLYVKEGTSTIPNTTTSLTPKGIVDGKYKQMIESDQRILATEQQKTEFHTTLKNSKFGFTKEKPLKLQYWTLIQSNDPVDKSYFEELSEVMNDLSDGLIQFEYVPYNANSTVDNVYYNKAVAMGDMLWAPDYNGIGTWIGYYFGYEYDSQGKPIDLESKIYANKAKETTGQQAQYHDTLAQAYHVTNLWKPLYEEINKAMNKTNTEPKPTATNDSSWLVSLGKHLESKGAASFTNGATGSQSGNNTKTYKDIKSNLDTEISIWAGLEQSNSINLINWMDSQAPIIPLAKPGLQYTGYKLVDPKYQVIFNVNGDINYRDFVLNNPQ